MISALRASALSAGFLGIQTWQGMASQGGAGHGVAWRGRAARGKARAADGSTEGLRAFPAVLSVINISTQPTIIMTFKQTASGTGAVA